MMLVMPMAQFSTISPLLLDVHPYRSLASSKSLSVSDEIAGMASIFTASIYISDSPWFFIEFSPFFFGVALPYASETFRKFTFFSSISKARKRRGSRKRLKATGQRMMWLICRHVTAQVPTNISSFSRYFLSPLRHPPTSVYFLSQDTATVLFTSTLCRHPSSHSPTTAPRFTEPLDFLRSMATPAAMTMQRTEMSILSGSTPSLIQRLIIYNNNKIWHYPQDTTPPTLPTTEQTLDGLLLWLQFLEELYSNFTMERLTSPAGKLLFFVYQLFEEKKVTAREKGILKDLIVTSSKDVMAAFQDYETHGTELTLTSDLLKLLRTEKQSQTLENSSHDSYKARRRGPIMVSIPKRNIQKLPAIPNRI